MITSTPNLRKLNLGTYVGEFAQAASTEVSTHDEKNLDALPQLLAPGTSIYVAHTPKASIDDVVRVAIKIETLGFRAFPHIAARRIKNESVLRSALRQLAEAGIRRGLLIAGDRDPRDGVFADTLQILDSGILADHGFRTIGVAGHPEGHPAASDAALLDALKRKQSYAADTGTTMHIVTQFSFDAAAVYDWEARLIEHGITLPVHVGLAGPTPLPKLLKFAMQCGVRVSKKAVLTGLSALSHTAGLGASPDEVLYAIASAHADRVHTLIKHPHFYALGGIEATARWLQAIRSGHYAIDQKRERVLVNA